MKNKFIAVLLILSFCFVAPVLANSYDLLSSVELTPFAGDTVTRAQFVAKVTAALKLGYTGDQNIFGDIGGHEYHDSICAALSAGLIAPADKFNPDDAILTIDAYRVALAAAGWVPRIKSMGGSDTDYLSLAKKLDLTKGILSDSYAPLMVADANTLIWNMLRCETEQQVVFGDKAVYQSSEGNTLLYMLYDIKEVTGIVTANEYTGLNSAAGAIGKDRIRIGSVEYIAADKQDFLGMNVRAYYITDAPVGNNVIVAMEKENTTELVIDGRKIEQINGRTISYYEGEKLRNVRLSDSFSCIKNGKKLDIYTENLMSVFTASLDTELTLIDANRDSRYETVLMTVRQYCYVESVDDKGVFYDKFDAVNNIDLTVSDVIYRFLDKDMSPEDIKSGMLITFTRSDDGKVFTIDTEYSTINGAIERTYAGEDALEVNGQKYDLTDYYKKNFSSVEVGRSGLFFLDSRGRLVVYDADTDSVIYGWIIDMRKMGTLEETMRARIYTQNDKAETFDFAEKVEVDGVLVKEHERIYDKYNAAKNKLVKFKRNKNGEISTIYFPKVIEKLEEMWNQDNQFLQYHSGTYRWQSNAKTFMEGFVLDSGSFLFVVPETESERFDEQNFNVFNGASGNFSNNSSYTVTSFDESSEGIASVVLYITDKLMLGKSMDRAMDGYSWVVEKKIYGIDENKMPRVELFVCNGSTYETIYSGENNYDYMSNLEPGDIIRFVEESNNVVKFVHKDFDFGSMTLNEDDYKLANTYSGGAGYVQGYLYGKYGTFMHMFEDKFQGYGKYRTDYTYADLKGYPVSATHTVYVDVKVNKNNGEIRSLMTYRAGSGETPAEYRLTGNGSASYVVSLFRSGATRSTVIYNIHAE